MDKTILFPPVHGVEKLIITEEGKYSITLPRDAQRTCDLIKKYVGTNVRVVDACGCVGGDTIAFARNFPRVDVVEINEDNYLSLRNNLKVFGLKNVSTHLGNVQDFLDLGVPRGHETVVFYADPPWGGRDYKYHQNLRLLLGDLSLSLYIKLLPKVKLFVFKVPFNYDFLEFRDYNMVRVPYYKSNGKLNYYMCFITTITR
jgi:hypothetical protein